MALNFGLLVFGSAYLRELLSGVKRGIQFIGSWCYRDITLLDILGPHFLVGILMTY